MITPLVNPETRLLVLLPSSLPVILVYPSGWFDAAGFNVRHLALDVILLALDEQVLALPLGFGVQGQEGLLGCVIRELDKDGTFEGLREGAAETDGVCGAVGLEESFNVELSGRGFLAEAFLRRESVIPYSRVDRPG